MAAILSPMPVWARPAFVRAAPLSAELVALPLRTAAVLPELEHRLGRDRGHPVAVARYQLSTARRLCTKVGSSAHSSST